MVHHIRIDENYYITNISTAPDADTITIETSLSGYELLMDNYRYFNGTLIKGAHKSPLYYKERIDILKDSLAATDYKVLKYAEGLLPEIEYQEIKVQRQAWRDEINRLQAELDAL